MKFDLEDILERFLEKLFNWLPYDKIAAIDLKARWGVIGGAPIIVVIIFYFLIIHSISSEARDIQGKVVTVEADIKASQLVEKNMPNIVKEINLLDDQLYYMRKQLPEQKEIPNLIDQVSNFGTQAGLEFMTFKPLQEQEQDFYAEVPVQIEMLGPFHNILSFFDRISRMPRILTVSNLEISKYQGAKKPSISGTAVVAKCKAVTYRFLEAKVDAKPDEKKAKK